MPPISLVWKSFGLAFFMTLGVVSLAAAAVNYEEAPINYRKTNPSNAITRLQEKLDAGELKLEFVESLGYLPALLEALDIPVSSQVMPFAKVSRQNPRISPVTPRAIYYNNDIHVGYVQEGLIEIAVSDPRLGMVFYTLDQKREETPTFRNESSSCLTCHGAARTRNVPGLQVRSVIPDKKGEPVIAAGSYRTDHSSPLEKRWGGWYVSGTHGAQQHLGNLTLVESKKPKAIDNAAGQNVQDLAPWFDTTKYLTSHSDIVALLVLEHQVDAHNFITLANFETRLALYLEEQQLKDPTSNTDEVHQATQSRIAKAGEALVQYLLFSKETRLREPIVGTSAFADDFASRGPRDGQGRSLHDFDLQARIFKYPCSYLIYSQAFDALPTPMQQFVFMRIRGILATNEPNPEYSHLTPVDRLAILEILEETKPGFAR